MRLPNYHQAKIDIRKLRDYCLNPQHPIGKHKARIFKALLGVGRNNASFLRNQILQALSKSEAVKSYEDKFGTRYVVNLRINNNHKSATFAMIWIIPRKQKIPQFVTCYVIN